jgi:uncharacterized OB-fold protein
MRCSKCGTMLIQSAETCISCGKANPEFRPVVMSYTSSMPKRLIMEEPRRRDIRIERWPVRLHV